MREAVIVSTARTPIGRAYRGAFNFTSGQQLGGHAIRHAVARAGIDGAEVEDVIMGNALTQGSTGGNFGRQAAMAAGLPVTVGGMTMDRQCSSGMFAIATAAKQIISDGLQIAVGGGGESISLVQNEQQRTDWLADPELKKKMPALYMSMLETAETVAARYGVSREAQDEYAAQSQARTAAAQEAGKFDDEIVPLPSTMKFQNKETGEILDREVTLEKDEGNRPGTTAESLAGLQPVFKNGLT
ncbi:MAG: acetyl-CoA C-acyltransferase, partial [Pikeienuella sp.]